MKTLTVLTTGLALTLFAATPVSAQPEAATKKLDDSRQAKLQPELEKTLPPLSFQRALLNRVSKPIEVRGRYEGNADGQLRISNLRDPVLRKRIAEHREVPLSSIPERVERTLLLPGGSGSTGLEALKGKEVVIQAVMDSMGFFLVRTVEAAPPQPSSRP